MDKLKLVKAAVFILTLLLILGTMLVLTKLYSRTRQIKNAPATIHSLEQPAGSKIKQMLANGGNIYILITDGGQPDRILALDPATAKTSTTINLYQQ